MASTEDSKQGGMGQEQDRTFQAPNYAPDEKTAGGGAQAVRFASAVQEIAPEQTLSSQPSAQAFGPGNSDEATPALLREVSKSLQGTNLQQRRMNIGSFEPFSLPTSRVHSHEDDSGEASRQGTRSSAGHPSPSLGTKVAGMHTPPLTPSASGPVAGESGETDGASDRQGGSGRIRRLDLITPQDSTQSGSLPSPDPGLTHRPASSDDVPRRPSSAGGHRHDSDDATAHRKGIFNAGGASGSGSLPVSREASPSRSTASQFYARPFTPAGDKNDPYAANKRQPQNKIEQRFVFSRKKKQTSPSSSSTSLPRPSQEKRHSGLLGHLNKNGDHLQKDESHTPTIQSRQNSMSDLRRFFKMGAHHKVKRVASPAAAARSGIKTPPSVKIAGQIPFGDDHGLTSKYGKLGRVLGAGAGGSVRLMKRSEDGVVFAVKEFRPRHTYETEREYVKKLTAEYCIGSSLHHGNIIETLDIVQERGKWYEVMEYAPFDLFAIVMTGRQSREEVACCFLQILAGVTYLHSSGLAHRDMKLDNVVVSDHGIMKIIDFGSAHVFRYPFENGIVKASGIVGSDPYLAPEVYDERKYDAEAVDIWSMAIIFCCMSLRRFPWKIPRLTDSSFKLFAAEPTPGHDPKKLILPPSRSTASLGNIPPRDIEPGSRPHSHSHSHSHGHHSHSDRNSRSEEQEEQQPQQSQTSTTADGADKKDVIRGPWRILRLLPRESRHIIGRMLEIDPRNRAKMDEILEDPWVANTVICRQVEPGVVENAEDHKHVLEPPAPSSGK